MAGATLLALDCGTQSVRALLFDLEGNLLARQQVVFEPAYHSPEPGWAEQPADYYWDCLVQACQGLWAQPGVDKTAIAGVAVTTQRATVVPVDRAARPCTRPSSGWTSARRKTCRRSACTGRRCSAP